MGYLLFDDGRKFDINSPTEFNSNREMFPLTGVFTEYNDLDEKMSEVMLTGNGNFHATHLHRRPSMFSRPGNFLKEGVCYSSPRPGFTLKENKENMAEWAYKRMLWRMSNKSGVEVEQCIELALWDTEITEDLIETYYL